MIEKVGKTLGELYNTCVKDFSEFLQSTGGLLFKEASDGQLNISFINDFQDLSKYFECTVESLEELGDRLHIIIKE